jgi:hypothetical protein
MFSRLFSTDTIHHSRFNLVGVPQMLHVFGDVRRLRFEVKGLERRVEGLGLAV